MNARERFTLALLILAGMCAVGIAASTVMGWPKL